MNREVQDDIDLYQVDVFACRPFTGNPAAVCVSDRTLTRAQMQAIAAENNISETAFLRRTGGSRRAIRWFTPTVEADCCAHATLAAAQIVFDHLDPQAEITTFTTRAIGELKVARCGPRLELAFPSLAPHEHPRVLSLDSALGASPSALYRAHDRYLAIFEQERHVRDLSPDFRALALLPCHVIAAAPADSDGDLVTRFFAPRVGIDEDPVAGSALATLAPYWAKRTGGSELVVRHLSRRGGIAWVRVQDGQVFMAGHTITVIRGTFLLPDDS
jgi:PhzF family phenazine biosynthesis protein